jgi:hypothetical protein
MSGEQKLEKFTAKKINIFDEKLQFICPWTSKLQEKSSSLSYASKLALSSLLWVSLALLDPDPYFHYGSGSSLPK